MKKKPQPQKPRSRANDPLEQFKMYLPPAMLERLEKIGSPLNMSRQDVVRPVVEMMSKIHPKAFFATMAEIEKMIDQVLAAQAAAAAKSAEQSVAA